MQGVHSNYDIDLFKNLIRAAAELAHTTDLASSSLRVIADHIRACTFLIVDGVLPSNEGRGYVLRRIIRRAVRHGYKLGIEEPFFYKLVPVLEREMGAAYPELTRGRQHRGAGPEAGGGALRGNAGQRHGAAGGRDRSAMQSRGTQQAGSTVIPGETVFKLYDTYGFPADLTADIARERGLAIDQAGFDARDGGAAAPLAGGEQVRSRRPRWRRRGCAHGFQGYEGLESEGHVAALLKGGSAGG